MGKKPAFSDEYLEKIDGIDWEADWPDVCSQLIDVAFISNRERIRQEYWKRVWRMLAIYGWAVVLIGLSTMVGS